jgi:hypothetical protein
MVRAPSCHSATHDTCTQRKHRAIIDALKRWNVQSFIVTHQDADIAKQALGGFVQNVTDFVLKVLGRDWEDSDLQSSSQLGYGTDLPNGFNNADQFLPLYAAISPHAPATFEFKSKVFHK